jgi:hypothetical protein
MLNDETATKFTKAIAKDLFTNGAGETADRLVMFNKNGHDRGGWSEVAVSDRIKRVLAGELSFEEIDKRRDK